VRLFGLENYYNLLQAFTGKSIVEGIEAQELNIDQTCIKSADTGPRVQACQGVPRL
jgi:hypothetical protein